MRGIVRKRLQYFLIILMVVSIIGQPTAIFAKSSLDLNAESAILVDAQSGKILYSKKADMTLPPASMTKMMTEYLVWEAIEAGEISWDDTIQISDNVFEISGNNSFSGVGLYQNVDYTVRELYEAMAVNSDNATTIALAELVAGSEGEFVKMMNDKAEEMGLKEYEFVNSSGLENDLLGDNYPAGTDPDGINLLSARSTALLAYHLVTDYPESLEISSIPEIQFQDETIENWNWMLPHKASYLKQFHYEGVDGLKTGFTSLAGYNFTGTAERDGVRLISVVMKTDSVEERFLETAKILDYGFSSFSKQEIFPAGYQLKNESEIPVVKGKEKFVEVETAENFERMIKKGEEENYDIVYHLDEDLLTDNGALVAPIEKGAVVGTAELVLKDGEEQYIFDDKNRHIVDLITTSNVEKSNWFMIFLGSIGDFFSNVFHKTVDTIKGWF